MHDEGVHPPGFGAEPGDAIAALLRSSKFELKQRIIFRTHDAKIIRHGGSCGRTGLPRGKCHVATLPSDESMTEYLPTGFIESFQQNSSLKLLWMHHS